MRIGHLTHVRILDETDISLLTCEDRVARLIFPRCGGFEMPACKYSVVEVRFPRQYFARLPASHKLSDTCVIVIIML